MRKGAAYSLSCPFLPTQASWPFADIPGGNIHAASALMRVPEFIHEHNQISKTVFEGTMYLFYASGAYAKRAVRYHRFFKKIIFF
jgi:hypothetical protein